MVDNKTLIDYIASGIVLGPLVLWGLGSIYYAGGLLVKELSLVGDKPIKSSEELERIVEEECEKLEMPVPDFITFESEKCWNEEDRGTYAKGTKYGSTELAITSGRGRRAVRQVLCNLYNGDYQCSSLTGFVFHPIYSLLVSGPRSILYGFGIKVGFHEQMVENKLKGGKK